MTPTFDRTGLTLYQGDVVECLRTLPADSVQCCVTSPPYWGLRDYGVDGQIGLEPTPELYVARMVEVFREVRRVLREDGTCWVNMGDGYAGARPFDGRGETDSRRRDDAAIPRSDVACDGLKPKDLIGMPWRLALALQADGWWLRSDIIWAKPNPMPESVTDRPTKAHEYVFLLTKSARYFWDGEAVRESPKPRNAGRMVAPSKHESNVGGNGYVQRKEQYSEIKGANRRDVWEIATKPCPEAHFATFPPELPERCVKAGTSEKGCCPACGAPWERVVKRRAMVLDRTDRTHSMGRTRSSGTMLEPPHATTTGWRPTCSCPPADPVPCTVLDPFMGSGTTAVVAYRMGRRAVGVELSGEYLEAIAIPRILAEYTDDPARAMRDRAARKDLEAAGQMGMFGGES